MSSTPTTPTDIDAIITSTTRTAARHAAAIDFHQAMLTEAEAWVGTTDAAGEAVRRHTEAIAEFQQELDQLAIENDVTIDHLMWLAR